MTTRTLRPGELEAELQTRLAYARVPRPARTRTASPHGFARARNRGMAALTITLVLTVFTAVIALAVHENTSLELDGNTVNDAVAGDDWNDLDDGTGDPSNDDTALVSAFQHDEAEPDLSHHEPSNKDDNAIDGPGTNEDWGCVAKMNVNNKDDLRHAYAAAYDIGGDLHLFFGADRDTNNGSANIAAWFFQTPVSCDPAVNDGSFTGHKTDGDLFIVSEFTNGGRVAGVNIYIWTDPNGIVEDGDECLGNGIDCSAANSGQDNPFATGIDCQETDPHQDPGSPNVCATVNGDGDGNHEPSDAIDVPWEEAANDPQSAEFFEGGLNLDALFPTGLDCFSQVMVETRSSFEFNANLFDLSFLNFDTCGSIKVIKQTDPDGSTADFDFDLSPDPNSEGTQTLSDGEDFTWDDLNAGTYTLSESDLPAGWNLTDISCNDDDVEIEDLGAGTVQLTLDTLENITCTFTNTQDGRIEIEKQTLPDGSTVDFTFAGDVAGTLSDGESAGADVAPGSYTSTETVPDGWTLTSIVCDDTDSSGDTGTGVASFEVDPGETVRCVFTNTQDGRIEIEKQTLPDGSTVDFTFAGDVAGTLSDGESAGADVAPGSYTSTETVPDGWTLTSIVCDDTDSSGDTGTGVASFEVDPGETVRCVFTNTQDGRIEIEKQTLPDGSTVDFTFAGDVAGTLSDGESAGADVAPGSYTSTETVPDGWTLTSIVCDDTDSSGDTGTGVASFEVDPGETVRCVFTNTQDGRIEIEKQTLPDGSTVDFTFAGDVAGTLSDGESAGADVAPGSYTSTETVPDGWTLTTIVCDDTDSSGDTGTGVASFEVDPGETVRCVFTNTQDVGQGCTPGFWKNHEEAWVGYTPGQTLEEVFDVPDSFGLDDHTLLQALDYEGGKGLKGAAKILLRAAVAALLNAANPGVDYPLTEAEIIADVNAALTGSRHDMLDLAADLDAANNAGCPLGSDTISVVSAPVGSLALLPLLPAAMAVAGACVRGADGKRQLAERRTEGPAPAGPSACPSFTCRTRVAQVIDGPVLKY